MTVTSREYHEPTKETEKAAPATPMFVGGNAWPVGIALLIFGIPMWLIGGQYTVEGWVEWINTFISLFNIAVTIPRPVGYWLLGILVPVAFIYSQVEVRHRPIRWKAGRLHFNPNLLFWVAWLCIVGTDLITTYTGVRTPAADAWQITRQVAASTWGAGSWATILTFAPEWMILGGVYLIKR